MIAGNPRSSYGFTLIELLVTLAFAIILATVAVPSYRAFVENNRKVSDFNTVLSATHAARSSALAKRESITIDIVRVSNGGWVAEIQGQERMFRSSDSKSYLDKEVSLTFDEFGRLSSCTPIGQEE